MGIAAPSRHRHELACRVSGGIEVTLYWSSRDNVASIEIRQPASDERLEFAVTGDRALDAFHHPFAHLPIASAELLPALERA
jgi:hypothetical protein